MIEWDTLVFEARRKAREVNPRACIFTDADILLAMADEIDRLRAANAELVELVKDYAEWLDDAGETGDAAWDARYRARRRRITAALAAAEATQQSPNLRGV